MFGRSYDRIVIKDQAGNSKVTLERSLLGDLTMKTEGGRTIIEKTGWFGRTTTYMPSDVDFVEAEGQ